MKNIILMTALSLFALGAQASYMQKNCSNADGSVTMANGHSGSLVVIDEEKLGRRSLDIRLLQNLRIDSEVTKDCGERGGGIYTSRTTSIEQVSIRKNDGSDFKNGQNEVSAHLICEFFVSSLMSCPKEQASK